MLVAFDIDDTLGDSTSALMSHLNRKFNKNHTVASVSRMKLSKDPIKQLYGISNEELYKIYDNESDIITGKMAAFDKAITCAILLRNSGYKVVYITARSENLKELTTEWVYGNGFPEGDIYFENNKGQLADKLEVSLFYEDNDDNIKDIMSYGIKCVKVKSLFNKNIPTPGVEVVKWNPVLDPEVLVKRMSL